MIPFRTMANGHAEQGPSSWFGGEENTPPVGKIVDIYSGRNIDENLRCDLPRRSHRFMIKDY